MHRNIAILSTLALVGGCAQRPSDSPEPPATPAVARRLPPDEALRERAKEAEARGDVDAAIALYMKARELTTMPMFLDSKIVALAQKQPIEQSVGTLGRLAREQPDSPELCGGYAFRLGEARRFREAAKEFKRCQELVPGNMERTLYFGVQAATMEAYAKRAAKQKRKGR